MFLPNFICCTLFIFSYIFLAGYYFHSHYNFNLNCLRCNAAAFQLLFPTVSCCVEWTYCEYSLLMRSPFPFSWIKSLTLRWLLISKLLSPWPTSYIGLNHCFIMIMIDPASILPVCNDVSTWLDRIKAEQNECQNQDSIITD